MDALSEKDFLLRCGFDLNQIIETSDGGALLDAEALHKSLLAKYPMLMESAYQF